MQLPSSFDHALGLLAAFGASIGLTKLLRSDDRVTWRGVFGRGLEGALICMCAGVALLFFPNAPVLAVLGVGGLLASLGFAGIRAAIVAWRNKK